MQFAGVNVGVSPWLFLPITLGLVAIVAASGYLLYRERARLQAELNAAEFASQTDDDPDDLLEAPDIDGSLMGLVKAWRHRSKAQKLARKGYVRWYKIGSTMSAPQWIKPETDGAGEREYQDGDQTYLFPDDALVSDQRTGAYVAVHRENEAEPINLRDPAMPALDADRLQEVINLEAESDAPGWFDNLDLEPQTLMWIMIGFVLLLAGAQQVM